MQDGVNIKKDESGNKISKQMNTWAFLSNWSHDDFHNEPLVSVFEFSEKSSWLQLCPSRKSPFLCGNPSLICLFARTALSGFQLVLLFSWDAFFHFFHFFCSFFLLFHCAFKTWLCSKWMKFFISLRKKNSLAQVPTFDPNGLSKYVM